MARLVLLIAVCAGLASSIPRFPGTQPEFDLGFPEPEHETDPATESFKQKQDETIDAIKASAMETVNNKTINNLEKGNTNNTLTFK